MALPDCGYDKLFQDINDLMFSCCKLSGDIMQMKLQCKRPDEYIYADDFGSFQSTYRNIFNLQGNINQNL